MLTQERLKELLFYNPKTGTFIWKTDRCRTVAGQKAGFRRPSSEYIVISIDGKDYGAHRLAWLYVYGLLPRSKVLHVDKIKVHNWISNLTLSDPFELELMKQRIEEEKIDLSLSLANLA